MRTEPTSSERETFAEQGFVAIPDFLSPTELTTWRDVIAEAVEERGDFMLPENLWPAKEWQRPALYQRINLCLTNPRVRALIVNPALGRFVAALAGIHRVRLGHDQFLMKLPYSPPTGMHVDGPWSYESDQCPSMWLALDDVTLTNGAMCYLPGVHLEGKTPATDFHADIGNLFAVCPEWKTIDPIFCPIPAGGAIFHHRLMAHGAGANMTPHPRRAMTAVFYPDGARYTGHPNILPPAEVARLKVGDPMVNDEINPLLV